MPSHQSSSQSPSWPEIASRWQELGVQWAQWWSGATPQPVPHASLVDTLTSKPDALASTWPAALVSGAVDPRALSALNAYYQPRWAALWAAVQAVLAGRPDARATLPEIIAAEPGDRRFTAREWNDLPYFSLLKQGYLLASRYLADLAALAQLPEADKHRLVFMTRQYLDAIAPSNFVATNPEVILRAYATDGASLTQGFANLVADTRRGRISMSDERAFAVGRNLAVTPGHVVFRNELIELIQYTPTTSEVRRRPLVIVPPCINKYYILDLTPENSFVRWAVDAGHTVFMISWRNIPPHLGHLTWDDYLEDGALKAIRVAKEIAGSPTVNALGFCVGGTLLACAAAVMAARRDRTVASLTLLTTMLDFADPGEIGVYVRREYLATREAELISGRRVHGSELAGAFASLRANELIWSYVVRNYLKGETPPPFDLLHWNADSANLPGPMYIYYLRNLYLDNRLIERGALTMAGARVDLSRVTMPAYIYASHADHIVPWRSAYRTTALLGGDITFVLGASGHIAGVINPPDKGRRHYWTNELITDLPDEWLARAQRLPGSWWPHWGTWLAAHGGAMKAAPREAGSADHPALGPAPGRYVVEAAGPRNADPRVAMGAAVRQH
jgi:polyhydroxyalkanoate synthase subunit PhaC